MEIGYKFLNAMPFLLVFLLPPFAAFGEGFQISTEDKEKSYQVSGEFSVCSGAYYAMAEVLLVTGSESAAQTFKENANGAYLSGAWLLASTGVIKNWQEAMHYAEEPAKSTKYQWMAQLELALTDAQKKTVLDALGTKIDYCVSTFMETQKEHFVISYYIQQ